MESGTDKEGTPGKRQVTIDPITRLEGHGKIEIFLDEAGEVEDAYFQVPELRGFERFCLGRPGEELPRITPRICGVCPTAHHMASAKALDAAYGTKPTETAEKLRRLIYAGYYLYDHTLHFYFLGGPDFVMGPSAPKAERNILGVIEKVGMEVAGQVIKYRAIGQDIIEMLGGKVREQRNLEIEPASLRPHAIMKYASEFKRVARYFKHAPGHSARAHPR